MKISLVLTQLNYGGAEKITINIANHLAPHHQVEIITLDPNGPLAKLIETDVKIVEIKQGFFWQLKLLKHLRFSCPDVIYSTFWDINCLLILAKIFFPRHSRIILRDSVSPIAHLGTFRFPKIYYSLYSYCYKRSDKVICLSGELEREAKKICNMKLNNTVVIPNPIPSAELPCRPRAHGGKIKLVSVGRLSWQKGFDLLIQAVANLATRDIDVELKIFGTGPMEATLNALIKSLGCETLVEIIPPLSSVKKVVAESDIYILSSRYEGVSNSMLEALGENVPVVATSQFTSAGEYIIDGMNGFLAKETSAKCIAENIERAILYAKDKPRRNHINYRTFDNIMEKYKDVFLHP